MRTLKDIANGFEERIEKEYQDYINGDDNFKQDHWDTYFVTTSFWGVNAIEHPVDLSDFRKKIAHKEKNFDRFLLWIIKAIKEDVDENSKMEDIFILDEQAKKYLEVWNNVLSNSESVQNSISWWKTDKIKWVDFSFEELATKMWDLFYEPLAAVLDWISNELDDDDISKLLNDASIHILEAWNQCKPYITDINELEKKSKHTFTIDWTDLSNIQLAQQIANLTNTSLKNLLNLLSQKLHKDSEADKWRNRLKLANELSKTSQKLKEASNLITT